MTVISGPAAGATAGYSLSLSRLLVPRIRPRTMPVQGRLASGARGELHTKRVSKMCGG